MVELFKLADTVIRKEPERLFCCHKHRHSVRSVRRIRYIHPGIWSNSVYEKDFVCGDYPCVNRIRGMGRKKKRLGYICQIKRLRIHHDVLGQAGVQICMESKTPFTTISQHITLM